MKEGELTPEEIAKLGVEFTKTPYGAWFVKVVEGLRNQLMAQAKDFTNSRDTKLAAIERAAAMDVILDMFKEQAMFAEHPEYFPETKSTVDNSTDLIDK